jgi:hypothetical protein
MGPWILVLVRVANLSGGTGIRSGTKRSRAEALQDITLAEDSYESSIS